MRAQITFVPKWNYIAMTEKSLTTGTSLLVVYQVRTMKIDQAIRLGLRSPFRLRFSGHVNIFSSRT